MLSNLCGTGSAVYHAPDPSVAVPIRRALVLERVVVSRRSIFALTVIPCLLLILPECTVVGVLNISYPTGGTHMKVGPFICVVA